MSIKAQNSINLAADQVMSLKFFTQSGSALAAIKVVEQINRAGYEAFFVGGCVRDFLLGRQPHDFDIASSASPDELEHLFDRTVAVGKQFGILRILVTIQDIDYEVEVARFRGESHSEDGRHPVSIYFSDMEEDAKRRDFTVNALYLDIHKFVIFDFTGGLLDIEQRILRAVGIPQLRFAEDHLRILRALRFVSQLGFRMEEQLQAAVLSDFLKVTRVSGERLFEEWGKLLMGPNAPGVLVWLCERSLLSCLFPRLQFELSQLQSCSFLFTGGSENLRWSALWIWAIQSGSLQAEVKAEIKNLKASSRWHKEQNDILFWCLDPGAWFRKSLGEILQMCREMAFRRGLEIYLQQNSIESSEKSICLHEKLRTFDRDGWPLPFLRGPDLSEQIQGPLLGRCLAEVYWAQLESLVTNKTEALVWARKIT